MILIAGSDGSMGTRYKAILKSLEVPFCCVERHTPSAEIFKAAEKSTGIIVATPTEIHKQCLDIFSKYKVPILCEKPLSKNFDELIFIRDEIVRNRKTNLTMTMQYEMLLEPGQLGPSFYDYFRHGNDGLKWDCLQVIALAKGNIDLRESSPVWTCQINGQQLRLSAMDLAYVDFVKRWLKAPGEDISRLFDIHMKVMEFEDGQGY